MIVFYMLIADARIPTIRATVMVGLMMIAIMVDRHPPLHPFNLIRGNDHLGFYP